MILRITHNYALKGDKDMWRNQRNLTVGSFPYISTCFLSVRIRYHIHLIIIVATKCLSRNCLSTKIIGHHPIHLSGEKVNHCNKLLESVFYRMNFNWVKVFYITYLLIGVLKTWPIQPEKPQKVLTRGDPLYNRYRIWVTRAIGLIWVRHKVT